MGVFWHSSRWLAQIASSEMHQSSSGKILIPRLQECLQFAQFADCG
jgi:hypothetical protein